MKPTGILTALSSRSIAAWVRQAKYRVVYAAPGIHPQPAAALAELTSRLSLSSITISLDFDEHTLRMGYGALEAVEVLTAAGIAPTHSPGFRSGILIVDDMGWVFTPTALYLEDEPQSDETPNAVELSPSQVKELAIRLSPAAQKEAIEQAESPEEALAIAQLTIELGVDAVAPAHMATVKEAIEIAPPVKFNVVRQVRVFEPYLQYVELSVAFHNGPTVCSQSGQWTMMDLFWLLNKTEREVSRLERFWQKRPQRPSKRWGCVRLPRATGGNRMKIQRNAKNRNPTNSKSCGAKERNLNASAQLNKEAVVSLKEEMGW